EFGFDQGFLYFDDRDRIALDTAVPNVPVPSLWLHQAYLRLVGSDGYHYRYADQVNQSVVRWLADAPDAPLFLFINYMDPHEPYRRHAEYDDRLELEPMPRIKRCPRNAPGFAEVARRLEPYQLDNYDSELAFTDAHIGRLLDVLKRGGRYDRSLIIVTADHGEAFGEHGHRGHGTSLYEEQIHVPLMVKYPHGARYGVEPAPFSLAKLVPLLMDSLSLDGAVAGRESIPVGGAPQGAVAEVRVKPNDHANRKRTDLLRSVTRTDHLKVIESKLRPTEVYDLASDPHEAANLIEVQRAVAELTVQYLERWASNAQSVQESVDDAAPLPQSAIARLRTLGYIGPSGSPTSD
ncbi:MAG: sulfatase-like hydrolase/transferase, partial [Phycisphaerae bacterium]